MLFFIGSIVLHIYNSWLKPAGKTVSTKTEQDMAFLKMMQQGCRQSCSIIIRHSNQLDSSCSSSNTWRHGSISACIERVMIERSGKQLVFTDPKISVPLREWTSNINQQKYPTMHKADLLGKLFVLITAKNAESEEQTQISQVSDEHLVKLSDCITPLAWKSGDSFGIIGECTEENLKQLALAFLYNCLEIEDNLQPSELCTVDLEGHAQNLLKTDSSGSFSPVNSFTDLARLHKSLPDDPELDSPILNHTDVVSGNHPHYLMQQRSNSSGESAESEDNGENLPKIPGEYLTKFEDGAGESLFSSGIGLEDKESYTKVPALTKEDMYGCGSSSASQQSSPSKGAFSGGFSEEGGGEALSPSLEYEGLLAPFRGNNAKSKPPNVLIYCGKKDSQRHFDVLKNIFSLCLNSDKYILYHLKHEHVFSTPWIENTTCLIVSCDRLYDHIETEFLKYFNQGGYVLSFSSTFDSLFVEKLRQGNYSGVLNLKYGRHVASPVTTICGSSSYSEDSGCKLEAVELRTVGVDTEQRSVIMEAVHESSGAMAVLSQPKTVVGFDIISDAIFPILCFVHVFQSNLDKEPSDMAISPEIYNILKQANPHRFEILRAIMNSLGLDSHPGSPPNLTACHMLASHQKSKEVFMNSLSKRLKEGVLHSSKMNLHFVSSSEKVLAEAVSTDHIPVYTDPAVASVLFNVSDYIENLETKELGHTVIHGDIMTSTMPVVDALMMSTPKGAGLIVIANRQTGGKGRGGNAWISPPGCAMFSLHMKLSLSSALGQKLSLIQHITTLAVVEAVTSLQGYQDFPLRIKWPNDIYYERNIKVGGAIVSSSIMGDAVDVNIGCGVNVRNNNPTACINELVLQYNKTHGANLLPLTTAQLIARTVTQIEHLVGLFQTDSEEEFFEKYHDKWIHGSQRVTIKAEEEEATVVGLDDYGFLKVLKLDGTMTSLHPDGNSFDMTKNLICPKAQ